MEANDLKPSVLPCRECQAGVMHRSFVTYYTWLGEELITVPNFPAWVCDVCGKRDYDEQAEIWLHTLLKPDAGKSTIKTRKTRTKAIPKPVITATDPKRK